MPMKISFLVSLLWLISTPVLAQNAADADNSSQRAAAAMERVADFAAIHGISAWPRLDGCEYARSFSGETVGLILTVESATEARARWDGRCHVPMRHDLTGVPPGLAKGRYVVAATSLESDPYKQLTNRRLQISGVLGDVPNDAELLAAAMAQICTPVAAGEETDHDCRDRNRKR